MTKSISNAMQYEDVGLGRPSKTAIKKSIKQEREYDIRKMGILSVVWYEVSDHWVGLLATAGVTYFVFSIFGTLIVGLFESFAR